MNLNQSDAHAQITFLFFLRVYSSETWDGLLLLHQPKGWFSEAGCLGLKIVYSCRIFPQIPIRMDKMNRDTVISPTGRTFRVVPEWSFLFISGKLIFLCAGEGGLRRPFGKISQKSEPSADFTRFGHFHFFIFVFTFLASPEFITYVNPK